MSKLDDKRIALDAREIQRSRNEIEPATRVVATRSQNNIVQQHIQIAGSSGIVIGNVVHNVLNHNNLTSANKDTKEQESDELLTAFPDKTTLKEMSHSNIALDEEAISIIAKHMGENWTVFARRLKFSEGQIYQFRQDHSIIGIREVIYQLLLEWKQNSMPKFGDTIKLLFKTDNKVVIQMLYHEYWLPLKTGCDNEETEFK